jgi:hypothetical protein
MSLENYKPFGEEWKKELMKMRKEDIVDLFQKSMEHKTIVPDHSLESCENYVRGTMEDFIAGISDKYEFMKNMGDYTMKLMDIFWKEAKNKIRSNPELLNS